MQKPVHPMLVHFPIALLLTSLLADAAYFFTAFEALRHAGWWTLAAASAGGLLAVMAGIFDMRRASVAEAVHERVHRHMWVGFALLVVICGLAAWRWTFYDDTGKPLTMLYLDTAFLAAVLAAFQGWLGGELVFTHGVFVGPAKKAAAAAEPAHTGDKPAAGPHASH